MPQPQMEVAWWGQTFVPFERVCLVRRGQAFVLLCERSFTSKSEMPRPHMAQNHHVAAAPKKEGLTPRPSAPQSRGNANEHSVMFRHVSRQLLDWQVLPSLLPDLLEIREKRMAATPHSHDENKTVSLDPGRTAPRFP